MSSLFKLVRCLFKLVKCYYVQSVYLQHKQTVLWLTRTSYPFFKFAKSGADLVSNNVYTKFGQIVLKILRKKTIRTE